MAERRSRYTDAGVDYGKVDPQKVSAQAAARETASALQKLGFDEVAASRGESAYVVDVGPFYLASITECLGTKALIADAMREQTGRSFYDAIARDTLAAAVNDLITVGALPISVHAYWSVGSASWFEDTQRVADLIRGWKETCVEFGVSWGGGETPVLNGVVVPGSIDLAASCVGIIDPKSRITLGDALAPGDAIVVLESTGIHANGVSLARQLATSLPGGFAEKIDDGRSFGEALLDPTQIYSKVMSAVYAAGVSPHYCVNVTGHGWRKLMRFGGPFTYRFHTLPRVPPVLAFLQRRAALDAREAYGTFNMGAGFAVFVRPQDAETVVRAARSCGVEALLAGTVEQGPKRVILEPLNLEYGADELQLRDA